jgi:phosphate transport system protein
MHAGNRIDVMSNHTMSAFDADLSRIRSEVIDMGDRVEKAVKGAAAALTRRDLKLAETVIRLDAEIDSRLRKIETNVVETIARRQPFAVDLRELVGAFHIVNGLERIGDQAKSICKRALIMEGTPPAKLLRGRIWNEWETIRPTSPNPCITW